MDSMILSQAHVGKYIVNGMSVDATQIDESDFRVPVLGPPVLHQIISTVPILGLELTSSSFGQ